MLRSTKVFWVAAAMLFAALAWAEEGKKTVSDASVEPAPPKQCVAVLVPTKGNHVEGAIVFSDHKDGTHVSGRITGLTPGKHGFHIHEFGDMRSADGESAGGHFNPTAAKHGGPESESHHAGDLGNIEADEQGNAEVNVHVHGLKMHFAVGRSIVVHTKADDLKTQPSGNSGPRVAVGVIGIANAKYSESSNARTGSRATTNP